MDNLLERKRAAMSSTPPHSHPIRVTTHRDPRTTQFVTFQRLEWLRDLHSGTTRLVRRMFSTSAPTTRSASKSCKRNSNLVAALDRWHTTGAGASLQLSYIGGAAEPGSLLELHIQTQLAGITSFDVDRVLNLKTSFSPHCLLGIILFLYKALGILLQHAHGLLIVFFLSCVRNTAFLRRIYMPQKVTGIDVFFHSAGVFIRAIRSLKWR